MAEIDPAVPHSSPPNGNTKHSAGVQDSPKIRWCFTIFEVENENFIKKIQKILENCCDKFVMQLEQCPTTGKKHLQGALWLKKKLRLTAMKKIHPTAHWEPMRNEDASFDYCQKKETAIAEPIIFGFPEIYKGEDLPKKLFKWQTECKKLCDSKPDDRTIHWLWEPVGRTGKSKFSKYMAFHHKAVYCTGGKKADILHMVSECENKKIFLIDLPRIVEDRVPYETMEQVKNGHVFSGKYESKTIMFAPPHVIVFANFPPDTKKMSADRWKITMITESDCGLSDGAEDCPS